MSARILRFGGSEHDEVERLLPWLLNGTLDADEEARAWRHLQHCMQCQGTVTELRALQHACAADAAAASSDGAFRRLQARLSSARTPPRDAARGDTRRQRRWAPAMAAALGALMLLAGGSWLLHDAPPPYRTLGDAAPATAPPARDQAQLVVVFRPETSQAQMQQLLRASGARIVNGPSDAGAYVLAVPSARADTVRERLRAEAAIAMVERLDAGQAP